MNESHHALQGVRKRLMCEEFGPDLPQSMQHRAEVGGVSPTSEHAILGGSGCANACKYTNKHGGRIATPWLRKSSPKTKNLLMPLLLMGGFPADFQEVKRPLSTKSVKRPIKVGKRPINEGKRLIKAMVLVGISGCFRAPPHHGGKQPL